ncbi:DUF2695 domain-containing protein [Glutamicibacter halophytocola]|uniref:DUF2695 domain-containing protein n=1 Tax=Glutamicibacter halophytocola TaxID=1933880 RepID=UPI000A0383C5|nr:DUF2695 domain-containing protein [Glutamicibacter halophytocola]
MSELPRPVIHECLPCYLYRVASEAACDGSLRMLSFYRDECAPRASALEKKMRVLGGYCDCEVLLNVVRPATTEAMRLIDAGEDLVCKGVRRGTIQPCENWLMRHGVQWGGGRFGRRSA